MPRKYTNALIDYMDETQSYEAFFTEMMCYLSEHEVSEIVNHLNSLCDCAIYIEGEEDD